MENSLIVDKPMYRGAYKIVLAGLRENSRGDGLNRRSVVHAMLYVDLKRGRLQRKAGQLLCGNNGGSFGIGMHDGEITCPGCKKIIERSAQ